MGRGTGPVLSVLVDTHCLVWLFGRRSRLSAAADAAIEGADHVLISPITWWEVGLLARDGRIRLDRPLGLWIELVLRDRRSITAPLSPEAAAWAGQIGRAAFSGDPADRLIYATARDLRVPLVSKDWRIREFAERSGDVDVVW